MLLWNVVHNRELCHASMQHTITAHYTLIQSCKMNSSYMFIVHELLYSDIQFEITMKSPVAILSAKIPIADRLYLLTVVVKLPYA